MQTKTLISALKNQWKIDATLTPLVGEYDLNFEVNTAQGQYILKVMAADCSLDFMQMQAEIFGFLTPKIDYIPSLIKTQIGQDFVEINGRYVWLISLIEGKLYADTIAKPLSLTSEIGNKLARVDIEMQSYSRPLLDRKMKWDLANADWIVESIQTLESNKQERVINIINDYTSLKPTLESLPKQAIHNDLNDYNILVLNKPNGAQSISGFIDFGDMISSPKICNIAICAAYIMLDVDKPLAHLQAFISGYHTQNPLTEIEVKLIWKLALMRLAVSVVNSALMKQQKPDDDYVSVSEKSAWKMIDYAQKYSDQFVTAKLLHACGFKIDSDAKRLNLWLTKNQGNFAPLFNMDLSAAPIFDFSVIGKDAPTNAIKPNMSEFQQIVDDIAPVGNPSIGRYAEPRLIYAGEAFFDGATQHQARDRRTVHMAIDVFLPAGTPVHAPYDGKIHSASIQNTPFDYGGLVTLEHITDEGQKFYTLYGHLAWDEVNALKVGQPIKSGQAFAKLGDYDQNGTWPPHVHFQLGLTDWHGADWPGVVNPDDLEIWRNLYPDPAPLLNLKTNHATAQIRSRNKEHARRKAWSGANLSLTYDEPLLLQRGFQCQMYDEWGRTYLDAFNNVPHVGHSHPRLAKVAARQMQMLNTNTRYLHQTQSDYAETMLAKMPDHIDTIFFLNSASEANELAMRMAREYTGSKHTIVSQTGYHGNTLTAIDISEYKFNGTGGQGAKDWVHVVPVPDPYRSEFSGADAGKKYAEYTRAIIDELSQNGQKLAAFITESFPSVGGQIIPPDGYLKTVFELTREAGGIAIADEVQTGMGRLGAYYWGFEQQDAVPDMIILGKPIGNGHPIGILATTRKIADRFANGMEFFSTFGGSTLSCTIGLEVLKIIEDEALQNNAKTIGTQLLNAFQKMQISYPSIGDVRGLGLFIGIEMIAPDGSPSRTRADYIANRMATKRILIGTDGPHHNVLKLRAPLIISQTDAAFLLLHIDQIFAEVESLDW
ncbi:MAG: aminotransferase class III-fold pyridoxal phosphate-dependent enzyme [Hyphomicrobiales bacterium]